MFELEKTENISNLINITRSNSGVSGPLLAQTHIELGKRLAAHMDFPKDDTTVVAMLRSGIFFAQGIYFQLGCSFQLFDPKTETFKRPETSNVILVDSVINTGKTLKSIFTPDMFVACNVINSSAVEIFKDCLFTVRVSENFYVGSEMKEQIGKAGPDTTLRLFNLI